MSSARSHGKPATDRLSKRQLDRRLKRRKRVVLIVNTRSRKGAGLYRQASRQLKAGGAEILASYAIKQPDKLNHTIDQALQLAPDILVVGSGDGTISEVVDHLAYSNVVLGFIPLGTTNNFARSLGIPLNIDGAIDTILRGQVEDIDLGRVNDDYFANVASIGISVEVAAKVPHRLKRRFGRLAYALTGLKVLISHRPFEADIVAGNRRHHLRTHQLVIANGRTHSGTVIAQDASIDSKQLTVFRIGRPGRWQLVAGMLRFLVGRKRRTSEQDYLTVRRATVATKPICAIEIDGEIKTHTPARFSVAIDALYVMVPVAADSPLQAHR